MNASTTAGSVTSGTTLSGSHAVAAGEQELRVEVAQRLVHRLREHRPAHALGRRRCCGGAERRFRHRRHRRGDGAGRIEGGEHLRLHPGRW